jgi:DNA-binding transcriptional regulator of glucitol operon
MNQGTLLKLRMYYHFFGGILKWRSEKQNLMQWKNIRKLRTKMYRKVNFPQSLQIIIMQFGSKIVIRNKVKKVEAMVKTRNNQDPKLLEEFSVEIGEVNGVKLYETRKNLKKINKNK